MDSRTFRALRRGLVLASSVAFSLLCLAWPGPGFAADDDPALTKEDMGKVAHWIAGRVAAARQPYCYRQSYGRGAEPGPCLVILEQHLGRSVEHALVEHDADANADQQVK